MCVSRLLTRLRRDMRFFFFLPAPTGPLIGTMSCGPGTVEGTFGVGALWEEGVGVGAG